MEKFIAPVQASGEAANNLENDVEAFRVPNLNPSEAQMVGEKILQSTEAAERADKFEDLAREISETSTEAYEVLNATNPEARTEFMEHPELRRPHNERGKLHREEIVGKLVRLRDLEDELGQGTYSDKQKQVLDLAIRANELENSFVMANILYNEDPSEKNAELHHRTNEALYGKPDRDTFLSLLNEKLQKIENKQLSPEQAQEYAELRELLGPVEPAKSERYRPQPETVKRFSELVNDFYAAPLFEHIPKDKDEFTVQEAADIAEEILREIMPDGSEWHAVVEPGRRSAAVSQEDKKIYFPEDRVYGKTYDRTALKKILIHELGTHAMRSLQFEDHSIGSLRTGLPKYEGFEEGIATAMEQAVEGKYNGEVGTRHYISIGLVNFMGKDFRDAYEIQKRISHLSTNKNNDNVMYNSVQRALRGTDVLPNNKDLVYYNGNEAAWKFIEQNIDDPELFDKLFLNAKIDITNPEHEQIAYEARVDGF